MQRHEGLTLIRGPPGTGKTRTIVGLLLALCDAQAQRPAGRAVRILVCTPSNTATDEIALRLLDTRLLSGQALNVVRTGVEEKVPAP